MRPTVAVVLVLLLITRFAPATFAAEDVKTQIAGIPTGSNIEVQMNDKTKLRGTRGEMSDSGFTLTQPGSGNRQIAFTDVASVKRLDKKSHTTRNVLIIVGVAVVVVAVVLAIKIKTSPIIKGGVL